MNLVDGIPFWGAPDEGAVAQIKTCARTAATLRADIKKIMDEVWNTISFGVGRSMTPCLIAAPGNAKRWRH